MTYRYKTNRKHHRNHNSSNFYVSCNNSNKLIMFVNKLEYKTKISRDVSSKLKVAKTTLGNPCGNLSITNSCCMMIMARNRSVTITTTKIIYLYRHLKWWNNNNVVIIKWKRNKMLYSSLRCIMSDSMPHIERVGPKIAPAHLKMNPL